MLALLHSTAHSTAPLHCPSMPMSLYGDSALTLHGPALPLPAALPGS